jgi:hypothetical protein
LSGLLAFVRDIIEATGQRWDRYVVGYDLRQQVYLFEYISRLSSTHVSPVLSRIRVARTAIIFLVVIAAIGAYLLWRRRKARPATRGPAPDNRARERLMATALYELLEAAMSAQGIPRGASTPPLRHAEALKGLNHPLADEVRDLTELYLNARFGGASITDEERRTFEARVKRVRSVRAAQVATAAT